jgi:predicted Zn-dependent peptidase
VGGIYNAFTGEEYTGYFAKVAAQHFELALDWVSDIFLNSILPEKEVEKEKGVIIEEINMIYDHPMSYVQTLWAKLLYGDQPAGWDIAGTKETVSKMTREKLIDYMHKQYVAPSTIISIAGNFDEKLAISKVKKCFSKIKITKPIEKQKVAEKQNKPEILLNFRETDQTHLCFGVRTFNLFHPQRYALDLLTAILGGMMSSRLFIEVRAKLGIAYYINSDNEMNPDTGFLFTQVGLDNKNVETGISTILKEYKKISKISVPQKELKKAKDYLKGKTTLLLESSDAQASFYAIQELLEKKILTPEEIFRKIDEVSRTDILNVTKEIFRPEKLNLAIIGPFKNKARFKKILKL